MKFNSSFKYAIGLALVGIAISSLVIFVERKMVSTNSRNQPMIALGEYLKNISTKSHLWFEEAMAGDESINIEKDVYGYLDLSVATLQSALNGEETELGKFDKTSDVETIKILKESIDDVENLKLSAQKRWEFRQELLAHAGDSNRVDQGEAAGGALDQEFDAAYEELQTTYDRLVSHIKQNVTSDNATLNTFSWTSVALIILVFAFLSLIFYRIQNRNDKLNESSKSKLKEESERIVAFSDFIQAVSSGNFDHELNMNDELGKKLVQMRNNLKTNSDNEQRGIWASTGMAQIGEILRSEYKVVRDLYDNITRYVVNYTKSNQGSLFILNEDDKNDRFLELVATYAFDRKKYVNNRIEIGQGLAGQCFLEATPIYMLDIPKDYVKITSGLGGANPGSLLIVPLKINDVVYGIIELASFKKYAPHEIQLVEKFAESIASTISAVRVNERTRILLEQTQQQAEEMRAQEEEVRQNMEELAATQEEMRRVQKETEKLLDESKDKEMYFRDVINGTNDSILTVNRDFDIVLVNESTRRIFGSQGVPMEPGFNVTKLSKPEEMEAFKKPYLAAFSGEVTSIQKNYFGREYIVTYNPLKDTTGRIIGVSLFTHDITDRMDAQQNVDRAMDRFKKQEQEYLQRIAHLEKELQGVLQTA